MTGSFFKISEKGNGKHFHIVTLQIAWIVHYSPGVYLLFPLCELTETKNQGILVTKDYLAAKQILFADFENQSRKVD